MVGHRWDYSLLNQSVLNQVNRVGCKVAALSQPIEESLNASVVSLNRTGRYRSLVRAPNPAGPFLKIDQVLLMWEAVSSEISG